MHLVTQRIVVHLLSTILITRYGMELFVHTLMILAVIILDSHGAHENFAHHKQKTLKSGSALTKLTSVKVS